jgi:citrate lyase subunit beta/citryl-CoA lyase
MATTTEVRTNIGEAGRQGKDVRSDLFVRYEPGETAMEIELQSRVGLYYGERIREQAKNVLAALGIASGKLTITDEGALPFVIGARIEAAVRRAGLGNGKRWLPEATTHPEHSTKDRLRRSRLYLPGSEPKYFINAGLHEPDAVILDLEDSVHTSEKDASRVLVRNTIRAVDFGAAERMVRINQVPLGYQDLEEVVPEQPDVILIPKVEHARDVLEVDRKISEIETREGIKQPIWLMPILESALGIENAFAIASASDRVCALTIGLEDYTADLGVVRTRTGEETLFARFRVVNAAKAAGVQAIDSVFGDVADMDGLRKWGEQSRSMGFEGMGCIHPSQIQVIHEAYAPSQVEIEKALKIVAAFEDAKAKGLGVVSLGSKMIDPPVVTRAVKLVERARKMGLLSSE